MEIITIDNNNYILGDYILINAPIYSKGCRSSRDLVRTKKIEASKFIYVKKVNDIWIKTEGKSVKFDKVIIKEDIIKPIPELNNKNQMINDDNGIEKAPDIIHLEDDEKFKDNDGNILNIETLGERKVENIYFKVKDIMIGFEINNLNETLIDTRNSYKINIDYKFFFINKSVTNRIIQVKKELYLTYRGLLRVLFVSRSGKVDYFIKWATEKLFTIQMGTKNNKEKLVGDILGVSAKVLKEVFNCETNSIPCVYLFTLGYVKDLRISMNIDAKYNDDSIVAKYGFTKELSRRTNEHIKTYNKINGCNLKLKYYSYLDPQYISNGENDIKDFILALNLKLSYENYDELIVIPKEYIKIISEKYDHIGKKYSGHISELITKIKELEDKYEKQELQHKYEIQTIKYEKDKLNNDLLLQKEQYEHQLLKKDYELLKIQKNNVSNKS